MALDAPAQPVDPAADDDDRLSLVPTRVRAVLSWLLPFAGSHLALLLGGVAAVLIAGRVLYVARFDPDVALTVVEAGGAATVVALILDLIPGVAGFAAAAIAALVLVMYVPPAPYGPADRATAVLAGVAIVLALAIAPVSLLALVVLLALGLVWLVQHPSDPSEPAAPASSGGLLRFNRRWPWAGSIALGAIAATVVVQVLSATGMWLPAERIGVREQVMVGYVVDEAEGWTTVLTEEDRAIERVRTATVRSREVCSLRDQWIWDRPIHAVLYADTTPSCPGG